MQTEFWNPCQQLAGGKGGKGGKEGEELLLAVVGMV